MPVDVRLPSASTDPLLAVKQIFKIGTIFLEAGGVDIGQGLFRKITSSFVSRASMPVAAVYRVWTLMRCLMGQRQWASGSKFVVRKLVVARR